MRALSVCQPFAHLILLPSTDPRHKRIENRQWNYVPDWQGTFAIHAAKRKDYGGGDFQIPTCDMDYGAIVGTAYLAGAFRLESRLVPSWAREAWPWAAGHRHLEGPVCLVLEGIRRLEKAIPWKGQLGVFQIPDEIMDQGRYVDVP